MFGFNPRPVGLVMAVTLMVAPAATADVLAPGTRGIDHEVWVVPGDFDGQFWLDYVVEEEDTLSSIAEKCLGTAAAWRRVAEANSLGEEVALQPGQTLRIPPRETSGGPAYHLFVVIPYPFQSPVQRVQVNRHLPFFKWGFQLVAVEEGVLGLFEEAVEVHGNLVLKETLKEKELRAGMHSCGKFSVQQSVSVFSLVRSMKTTFEVTSVGGGQLGLKVHDHARSLQEDGATGERFRRPMALASLGLGSLGCLVLLRRRGRFEIERAGR